MVILRGINRAWVEGEARILYGPRGYPYAPYVEGRMTCLPGPTGLPRGPSAHTLTFYIYSTEILEFLLQRTLRHASGLSGTLLTG